MTLDREATNKTTSPQRLRELAILSSTLARLVANNPNTDGDLLRDLIATSDGTTRHNVATHPNTPPEVLLKLAWQFPKEVLENPGFEQILVENPNLLKRLSKKILLRLLKQDKVPPAFLEWVADYPNKQVLLAVAIPGNTSTTALEKLNRSQYPEVVEAAKLHVNWAQTPSLTLDEVLTAAASRAELETNWQSENKLLKCRAVPEFILPVLTEETRLKIARSPDTSAKVLARLVKDSDERREVEIRVAVAQHPHAPKNVLEQLLGDRSSGVSEWAANHPKISLNILQEFHTRQQAILNPNTPSEILSQLASSTERGMSLSLARHPNTPGNILENFAASADWQLRLAVAFNLSTPISVLQQLTQDTYWEVRWAVAQNLSSPTSILEQLLEDSYADVSGAAQERLDAPSDAVHKNSHIILSPNLIPRDRYAADGIQRLHIISKEIGEAHSAYLRAVKVSQLTDVVQDVKRGRWKFRLYLLPPDTPVNILQQLAESQDSSDRSQAASHSHTPVSLLEELAMDESGAVRGSVANNPNTPVSLLQQLIRDSESYIIDQAAKNLSARILYNPNTPETLLQQLAEIPNQEISIALARHPNTPATVLEQLANSDTWQVRELVAQNPRTPLATIEKLVQAENSYAPNAAVASLSQKLAQKYAQHSTPTLSRLITFFHPQTPGKFLAKNFRSFIWLDRYAIAQNTNTPRPIVQKLAEDGNRIVRAAAEANLAQQPISSSAETETNLSQQLGSVFRGEAVSAEILEWAANLSGKKALLAVANHPHTPQSVLAKLTASKKPEVAKAAMLHVNWAGDLDVDWNEVAKTEIQTNSLEKNTDELQELAEIGVIPEFILSQLMWDQQKLANDGKDSSCRQIAKNPHTPTNILEQLARHINASREVAANPDTPANVLESLAIENKLWLHEIIIHNPNTPAAVVERLQHIQQLHQKAKNPETPEAELKALAKSDYDEIREAVANNPSTGLTVLEQLAADYNPTIRSLIDRRLENMAKNANTFERVLERSIYLRKRVAQNPNIPLKILEALAKDSNFDVRMAVIRNPQTPERIMEQLAEDIITCGMYSLEEIAKQPNMPLSILEQLSESKFALVQRGVASNPKTPVEILEKIMQGSYSGARTGIASNPNTPVEMLEKLVRDSIERGYGNDEVPVAISKNPKTPAYLLEQLANLSNDPNNAWTQANGTSEVEMALAENPNTPISVLEKLTQSKNSKVRGTVGANPKTPVSILEELFVDHENDYYLACNPQLPLHILERLVKSTKKHYTRKVIFENHLNIPANILEQLAVDARVDVRIAVAKHPNTSTTALSQLAGDTDSRVSQAVAENPNQPLSLIQEVKVACLAAASHFTSETELARLALSPWQWVNAAVASNPNTSVATLEQLAADKSNYISQNCSNLEYRWFQVLPTLQALAENPHTPAQVLESLLKVFVNKPDLREAIARHHNSSVSVLEQLATDSSENVRKAVAENPNTPITLLEKLVRDSKEVRQIAVKHYLARYPSGLPLVLKTYAKSSKPNFSRFIVLLHPQTPAAILTKNSRSLSWLERYAIAQNPHTPRPIVQKLTDDANRIVSAAAKANLSQQPI